MNTVIKPDQQPDLFEILQALEGIESESEQHAPEPPAKPPGKFTTNLAEIKKMKEDYEWYPTTNEILLRFGECVMSTTAGDYRGEFTKILDVGAGNGKVLEFAAGLQSRHNSHGRNGQLFTSFYAIEKSQTHLSNLKASTYIMGVDFHKVTLLDKEIGVLFCNPPYSEYQEWTQRIIRETPSGALIYLVIPERWQYNELIQAELKDRGIKAEIKGEFSFEDAEDRQARAKVHLLEIKPKTHWRDKATTDPFVQFFNDNFTYPEKPKEEKRDFDKEVESAKVVHGANLIEALCYLYEDRMKQLQGNYSAICSLDLEILKEFEISKNSLIESLRMKLGNAKKQFWERLFDGMKKINERLTCSSRKTILALMQDQTGIDFNRENCYAIVMWVIKNANGYFDSQLINTYERLVEFANVESYVSNKRVFTEKQFSYHYKHDYPEDTTHYRIKVGHRIVLQHCGGIEVSYGTNRGLSERGCNLISDLLTIANNLGFTPLDEGPHTRRYENDWKDSDPRTFSCTYKGKTECLFRVRAFLNANMHFQFLPEFIHALNIQHGKLKGWIHTREDAEREVQAPPEMAAELIDYKFRIESGQLLLN
jgi:hypothetical protein